MGNWCGCGEIEVMSAADIVPAAPKRAVFLPQVPSFTSMTETMETLSTDMHSSNSETTTAPCTQSDIDRAYQRWSTVD